MVYYVCERNPLRGVKMKLQTVSNKKRQEALIANLKSKNPEWVPAENYALGASLREQFYKCFLPSKM